MMIDGSEKLRRMFDIENLGIRIFHSYDFTMMYYFLILLLWGKEHVPQINLNFLKLRGKMYNYFVNIFLKKDIRQVFLKMPTDELLESLGWSITISYTLRKCEECVVMKKVFILLNLYLCVFIV
ncbi:hypothetical protein KY290_021524 [Solanum tuberosum]|uniref:Uncharacterized protein n=1 Tax=Solanum tuberosum TaxID=4113 RepID=A0ABQ7V3U4_SOLTU|nr:hypothetical protein KY289_020684 [Solanum tuberosum]KAH0758031.1 hypothetical protein KY290_021524 [Solanum tuberosum]